MSTKTQGGNIMIVVAAVLKAAEGKGDTLEQEFRKLVPRVLKDPGAIAYAVHRAIDDPNKFLVYEKYESRDALKFHSSTPHFQEFSRATATLLAGRPEVALYNEIK
jgi:quinol monooxygenase YgiN